MHLELEAGRGVLRGIHLAPSILHLEYFVQRQTRDATQKLFSNYFQLIPVVVVHFEAAPTGEIVPREIL
jgi:hypothetical protein